MDKVRTFIAILLPAAVRRRLAEIEGQLKTSGADVKWVAEENLHITLKFLGCVEPDRLGEVIKAIGSAVEGVNSFDAALSGIGAFPKVSRPSVVWAGVTIGCEELKALAERVEDAMERIGFAREARIFSLHVTLGRLRLPGKPDRLPEIIERLHAEEAGTFRVESVAVMRSDLRPTGPIYTEIGNCKLKSIPQ